MQLSDFTSFEKLISPTLIKILYWVGIVVIVLGGLRALFTAFSAGGGVLGALLAIVGTIAFLIGWRVACEIYIVVFGIYDRLGEIRDRGAMRPEA